MRDPISSRPRPYNKWFSFSTLAVNFESAPLRVGSANMTVAHKSCRGSNLNIWSLFVNAASNYSAGNG
jgi:hypothetical protein